MSALTVAGKADTTRRDFLRRASTATAGVAVVAVAGTQALSSTEDAKLRRLWSEYLGHLATAEAIREKRDPARAAFDAEFPPCPDGVLIGDHWHAHNWLWQKHGLHTLSDAWEAACGAARETIASIRNIPAEGVFGIGVKLAALPADWADPEDYQEAAEAAFADIDRLIGSDFAARDEGAVAA